MAQEYKFNEDAKNNADQSPTWEMTDPVFEIHPEGMFEAVVTGFVNEGEQVGKFGPYISAYFEVNTGQKRLTDDQPFFPMRQYVTQSKGKESKTYRFRKACNGGRDLTDAENSIFTPTTLIGSEINVVVEHYDKDGKQYARIANVLPRQTRPQAQPPAAQQQTQPPAGYQPGPQDAQPGDDGDLPF